MRHSRQRAAPEPAAARGPRLSQRIDPLASQRGHLPMPRTLRLALVLLVATAGLGMVLCLVALVVYAGAATVRSAASAQALRPTATRQAQVHQSPARHRLAAQGGAHADLHPSGRPARDRSPDRSQRQSAHRASVRPRPGRTIATFSSSGSTRTSGFTVPRTGVWGLSWRYACPAGLRATFAVSEAGPSLASTLQVARSLRRGQGLRWISHDAGRHHLLVVSDCSWTVGVVLPGS